MQAVLSSAPLTKRRPSGSSARERVLPESPPQEVCRDANEHKQPVGEDEERARDELAENDDDENRKHRRKKS